MKLKGTKNLTFTQRLQIETLFNAKHSKKEIANIVGVCLRTIQREFVRGAYERKSVARSFWYGDKIKIEKAYSAQIAQDRYNIACSAKGRPLKIGNDFEFVHYIEKRVNVDRISACAALGQIKRNKIPFKTDISKTTLYRYIEMGIFDNIKIQKRKKNIVKLI